MTMSGELVPTPSVVSDALRVARGQRAAPSAISQFLFVVFKWRRLILGLAVAFTIAAAIVAFARPASRTASAKILFKPDRAALQISNLAGATARLPYSPQVLQSEVELFRSRGVTVPVARAMLAAERPAGQEPAPDQIEAWAAGVSRNMLVTTVPDTSVIQVTYSAGTAEEALKGLDLIVRYYMDHHAAAYRDSPGVLGFYEKETGRAAAELRQAEDALKKWQEANRTVNIDAEITAHLEKLTTLERQLHQTEADIQGNNARLQSLERLAEAQPERSVMTRERLPNPLIAKLRADIADAEIAVRDAASTPLVMKLRSDLTMAQLALEDLRRRYTDRERVVEEKKEQIANLRQEVVNAERQAVADARRRLDQVKAELAQAQKEAEVEGRESTGPNPLREGLMRDLVTARAQATALASQRDALARQASAAADLLTGLRDKKVAVDRLARAVTVGRDSYLTYVRRLEDARISSGLDQKQLTDVAVIEPPYALPESGLGRKIVLVALASVVGMGLGLAGAFGMELLNNSVRNADDVEFYLGLPVLATIPVLPETQAGLVPSAPARLPSIPVDPA
jgi:uncharacterized protein involved in exopolysaccharide biosynthesis